MTSELYLTKRRKGYYYIGFFEGNYGEWRTTKCSGKVLTNLCTNEMEKWFGLRGARGEEARVKNTEPLHTEGVLRVHCSLRLKVPLRQT